MIRPRRARWFEALLARDDAFAGLEALANSGCVEVESPAVAVPAPSHATVAALCTYASLLARYSPYLPAAAVRRAAPTAQRTAPFDALTRAVERLQSWAEESEPMIARLQEVQTRAAELLLTEQALGELRSSRIDLARLAQAQHGVTAQIFALPLESPIPASTDCLLREARLERERLMVALGPSDAIEALGKSVIEAGGRRARLPAWIGSSPEENLALAAAQRAELAAQAADLRAGVDSLARRYDIAHALGDVSRAAWCYKHGGDIAMGDTARGEIFARIVGWTVDPPRLEEALVSSEARALVRFPPPPRGAVPPLVLQNPPWVRPFEFFTRLFGMPAETGADPSVLLACAVPLMFGYMFGDFGQGLVLVATGALLGRKVPALKILVAGGIAASIFGLLFGSFFCSESVLRPAWLSHWHGLCA